MSVHYPLSTFERRVGAMLARTFHPGAELHPMYCNFNGRETLTGCSVARCTNPAHQLTAFRVAKTLAVVAPTCSKCAEGIHGVDFESTDPKRPILKRKLRAFRHTRKPPNRRAKPRFVC